MKIISSTLFALLKRESLNKETGDGGVEEILSLFYVMAEEENWV